MGLLSRLIGKSMPVRKSATGFITFGNDEYRLDRAPRQISLTFEEGESPSETSAKIVQRMKENGTGMNYLDAMLDIYGNPIAPGVRLHFYQWKRPFIWKLYANKGGRLDPIGETDLPEQDAIKWALKQIREQ